MIHQGQFALHHGHLGCDEARGQWIVTALAQRIVQRVHPPRGVAHQPCRQRFGAGDQLQEGHDLGVVVQAGVRIAPLQRVQLRFAQCLQRRLPGRSRLDRSGGFVLMVGEPLQDKVFLGREVGEQGPPGDLRRPRNVGDRDLVESCFEEHADRRGRDRLAQAHLLSFPQSHRFGHGLTLAH